jgi:hypothetical protein
MQRKSQPIKPEPEIFLTFKEPKNRFNPPAYVAWRAGTTTLFLLGF